MVATLVGEGKPIGPTAIAQEVELAPAVEQNLPAITVSRVANLALRDRIIVSGLVGAVEVVNVQPLIQGQPIEALESDVGDLVTAGQVLARLSSTTLELQKSQFNAALASARATIAQAEAQVLEATSSAAEAQRVADRTSTLRKQGTASQAAADQANANAISATARVTVVTQSLAAARAQLELAQAQMGNVELELKRTNVVAPVAGKIVSRNAQVGSVASAVGLPMFTLTRDNALELRADVAESDLLRIKLGQTVTMRAVGTRETLSGKVRLIEPSIDLRTRLGGVRISIDTPEMVRVGMFISAEILAAQRDSLAIPVTAIGSTAQGASVMTVKDGLVTRAQVTTGIRDGALIEILSGLAQDALVVTKAAAFVRDGDRINPVLDSAAE
ncbi:MAG: hemolysin D [Rhodobacter sp. BACL10 MAG-121220-bin24]|nr:MAG: hemolysin D [Rhodobacter sp. BACL10 MAG-120910-bin24]KRO90170.1 MAG: hemolysin D [Rhodobacter sp. BACL10 MAG-121220-bin24]KRP24688.1 MAG: hemolysin D [Rhodobacter sp. BACL10 MAG-120419-bin15]